MYVHSYKFHYIYRILRTETKFRYILTHFQHANWIFTK